MAKHAAATKFTDVGSALAYLDKNAKGLVESLKDSDARPFEVLSTGVLAVDVISSIGGFPFGKLIELSGEASTGKCISLDSWICTSLGWMRAGSVLGSDPAKLSYGWNNLQVPQFDLYYLQRPTRPEMVFVARGQECQSLETWDGFRISGTCDHRIQVMSLATAELTWKSLSDVEVGDLVVVGLGTRSDCPDLQMNLTPEDFAVYLAVHIRGGRYIEAFARETQWLDVFNAQVSDTLDWQQSVQLIPLYGCHDPSLLSLIQEFRSTDFVGVVAKMSDAQFMRFVSRYIEMRATQSADDVSIHFDSRELAELVQLRLLSLGLRFGLHDSVSVDGGPEFKLYPLATSDVQRAASLLESHFLRNSSAGLSYRKQLLPFTLTELCKVQFGASIDEFRLAATEAGLRPEFVDTVDQLLHSPDIWLQPVLSKQNQVLDVVDFSCPTTEAYEVQGFRSHNSSLALTVCKAACDRLPAGEFVVYMDFERSFDRSYARRIGLPEDRTRFMVISPNDYEEGSFALDTLYGTEKMRLVVVDSIAAMTPRAMMERKAGETVRLGMQGQAVSDFVMRWSKLCANSNIMMILINQMRARISTNSFMQWDHQMPSWAQEFKVTGGFALEHMTSMRIMLQLIGKEKATRNNPITGEDEECFVSNKLRAECWKNKVGVPFRRAVLWLDFGIGFDNVRTLIDVGKAKGVIDFRSNGVFTIKAGPEASWTHGKGSAALDELVRKDKGLQQHIIDAIDWKSLSDANIGGPAKVQTIGSEADSSTTVLVETADDELV